MRVCSTDLTHCEQKVSPLYVVEPTVSNMPDARGLPSRRTGFPPINLESFLSKGSSVVFQAAAAAMTQISSHTLGLVL